MLENVPETPAEVREGCGATRTPARPRSGLAARRLDADRHPLRRTPPSSTGWRAPGAARTQLTFFDEPVAGAAAMPGRRTASSSAATWAGPSTTRPTCATSPAARSQLTEPGTRNQSFVFSKDGRLLAWSQVTPGPGRLRHHASPTRRPGRPPGGTRARAPSRRWTSRRTAARCCSAATSPPATSERFLLDLASGRLTEINPRNEQVAYDGGEFTPDGRARADRSPTRAPTSAGWSRIDLASGARDASPTRGRSGASRASTSPTTAGVLAYAVNEEGYSRVRPARLSRPAARCRGPKLPQGVLTRAEVLAGRQAAGLSLSTADRAPATSGAGTCGRAG